MRISTLRAQFDWLLAHHYRIVSLRAALGDVEAPASRAGPPEAVISVDDGHESIYTRLYPLIRAAGLPVTLFIYPSAISNAPYALTWDQLREMRASGLVDVESHTYWHPNFKIERRRRTTADFKAFVDLQLQQSRLVLQAKLASSVDMLAWPFGIVDADLEAAARRAGYAFAFAYDGGPMQPRQDPLALPRIPVSDVSGAAFGALLRRRAWRPEP